MTGIRVTINLNGTDRFAINRHGLTMEYNFMDEWESVCDPIDLDRAEVLLAAALRSVQCLQEIEGCGSQIRGSSGAKLTLQRPRPGEEVERRETATDDPSSPPKCKCGKTTFTERGRPRRGDGRAESAAEAETSTGTGVPSRVAAPRSVNVDPKCAA